MFGVAPAAHDFVLYGLIGVGLLLAAGVGSVIVHAHYLHRKILAAVKKPPTA